MVAVLELRHPASEPRPGTGRARFADDSPTDATLDELGVVGSTLRHLVGRAAKAKLLLRGARDPISLVGRAGTGRHLVAEVLHRIAGRSLGRTGPCERVLCGLAARDGQLLPTVERHLRAARGGTLVLDQLEALEKVQRQALLQLLARYQTRSPSSVLVIGLDCTDGMADSTLRAWRGPRVALPPCHERAEDLLELVHHFAEEALLDACVPLPEHEAFTAAPTVAAVVEHVRKNEIASVGVLREVVRDLVFDALADGGACPADAISRLLGERGWKVRAVAPAPDVDTDLLARLAELHGVSEDTLLMQMQVIADVMSSIDSVPRSYTNVMRQAEEVKRAGLWLLTAAGSQAEFRRWFGDEEFMRPSKSGAWSLYHQVFKLDT